MANEKELSTYHKVNRLAKTENYQRSNHNDFATTSELKQREFSGWRANKITEVYELWIVGNIVRTVSAEIAASDPSALEKVYAEYFDLM